MGIDPLWLTDRRIIPAECLAVSYTRSLVAIEDGVTVVLDGVEAARRSPSAVDLRVDIANAPVFTADERARILAFQALRADRRGVIRMEVGEFESRPKNLSAARERMAEAIAEALATPLVPEIPEKKKRGRVGLLKVGDPTGELRPAKSPASPAPRGRKRA